MTFVCNLVTLSCDFWTQATCVPAVPQSEEDCHLLGGLGLPPTAPTCTRIITEVQCKLQGLKIINVHFFSLSISLLKFEYEMPKLKRRPKDYGTLRKIAQPNCQIAC